MTDMNINFGRFTLKNSLGKGSFGEVYKAYDPQMQQDVALKIFHQGLMVDLNFVNRARKEATLVQQIQHPNVVKIFELGEFDGRTYIEMEFIDGQPLSEIIRSNIHYNVEQIITIIEEVASALDATHAKKIVHRDVKPANILIDKGGKVHLVDFGLAHAAKSSLGSSSTAIGMGTAMYMSPEQAMGHSGDKTADVYSLGIVAFELFTGRLPFQSDNLPGYIQAHLHQKPPTPSKLNPAIPKNVQQVLLKALNKNPANRYRTAGDFASALRRASEKPVTNSSKVRSCLVVALVLSVAIAIFAWAVIAGPLEQPIQQLIGWFPSIGYSPTTQVFNVQPTNTTHPVSGFTSGPATQENAPTAPPQPSEPTQSTIIASSTAIANFNITPTLIAPTFPSGELPVLLGTGVKLTKIGGQATGIAVRLMNGTGEPITDQYFQVFTQKQDLAGNWVTDQRVNSGSTDNSGQIFFQLEPGGYIIGSDFSGYNWGTAGDVDGQANVNVESGQTTQLTLTLGRLTVGFLRGDGSVITQQYVQIYRQKKDLAGNWVIDKSVNNGSTDNTGLISFDLAPGYYIVSSDLPGYNWGSAGDVKGMASTPIKTGSEYRLVFSMGQLQIGLKDSSGNPLSNQYVQVYTEKDDVSGKPALGDNRVASGSTDNTGIFTADLTPGKYAIQFSNQQVLFDIVIASGKITFTNGSQWEFK